MTDNWLDKVIRADAGAPPTPPLTHSDLTGFPAPVLTSDQNQRFIILNAEIGYLMRKMRSRKKADVAIKDIILAQIGDAKRRRDAVFGSSC